MSAGIDSSRAAVVGAGAVGGFFGAMLARGGTRVTLLARAAQVAAIARDGLRLEMGGRVETLRQLTATIDPQAALAGAELVLVCVKSTDTERVGHEIAPHIATDAVVLSLQNGVENADTLARCLPGRTVLPAVVYVATAMPEPGLVRHFGRGDLVIGPRHDRSADAQLVALLDAVVARFAAAQVPVRIADDVRVELWSKLMVNCAYNAISAVAQAPYGQLAALPAIVEAQLGVVREVVALARAEGIALELDASIEAMHRIAVAMPAQLSSTAQDLARHKPSEIDHLNGFVARRGRELGVPTPLNALLHALVKLIEGSRHADGAG